MGRVDIAAIRVKCSLPSIVVGCGIKLRRTGAEWKACCPFHRERTPSFTIYSGGERFQCFGCGAQGDLLDFVQRYYGVDLRSAAEMLSGAQFPVLQIPQAGRWANSDHRTDDALAIWRASGPVEGTPAEAYLRGRGITIDLPRSLRFAVLPYGKDHQRLPCLVCCVSSREGPLQGIQRVFLATDGSSKADVRKPKLSLGKVSGGAIRLGPLDGGELVVCEGPEDGLSLLQALGRPVWVAAGASMLPSIRFPSSVRSIAVGGDNDDAGRAAASKAARAYAARGLAVQVFYPSPGFKDHNDELREIAR